MNEIAKIADLTICNFLGNYHIYHEGGCKFGFAFSTISGALRAVADILDMQYRDTESGQVLSYAILYEMWDHDLGDMRTGSTAETFREFLHNATDKNGFLEEIV